MAAYQDTFTSIPLSELATLAQSKKDEGARFINLHAATVADGFVLTYTFTGNETVTDNYQVHVTADDVVPAISPLFLAAFVFENEVHDLFGINIEGIAVDFKGDFYQISIETPMAVPTKPEHATAVNTKYGATVPVKQRKGEEQ